MVSRPKLNATKYEITSAFTPMWVNVTRNCINCLGMHFSCYEKHKKIKMKLIICDMISLYF